jgi:hypothetical protein
VPISGILSLGFDLAFAYKFRVCFGLFPNFARATGISNGGDDGCLNCPRMFLLRRPRDAKMVIFIRAYVCTEGASSEATHLRVRMNWDVLKHVQSTLSYYIQIFKVYLKIRWYSSRHCLHG